jgi:hypothetical protein
VTAEFFSIAPKRRRFRAALRQVDGAVIFVDRWRIGVAKIAQAHAIGLASAQGRDDGDAEGEGADDDWHASFKSGLQ